MQVWEWTWLLLCAPTPKPLKGWRVFWFRVFGGKAGGNVYLHPRARIEMPWNITLGDGAAVGDRAHLYALGPITIGSETVVAQESYLCAGTHDFDDPAWPLVTRPITVGNRCFLGLRTVVLPNVSISDNILVGAGALVTKNLSEPGTYVGQPAKKISDKTPC